MKYAAHQQIIEKLPKIRLPQPLRECTDRSYLETVENELRSRAGELGLHDPVIAVLGGGPHSRVDAYAIVERAEALKLRKKQREYGLFPQIGSLMYDIQWFERHKRVSA